jgi:hypothetical protein
MRVQGNVPAMPAVPPLAMCPSQLDAYQWSTGFISRPQQQALFTPAPGEQQLAGS